MAQSRKGFCKEACVEVINILFDEGLSVDGNILVEEKLYATTLFYNVAAYSLLENLGFKSHAIYARGVVMVAQGVYDEESDDFLIFPIKRYVIETGKVSMDDLDITLEKQARPIEDYLLESAQQAFFFYVQNRFAYGKNKPMKGDIHGR